VREEKLNGTNIAIVAIGRSQVDFHLSLAHSKEYDEVWGINCMGAITKCDKVFMLDPVSRFLDTEDAGTQTGIMRKWLPKTTTPIYSCELDKRAPSVVEYPLSEVINDAKCAYLNNTVAFAIAYAFYQRVGQINLFGVDFSYKGNVHFAEQGRACCEYWIAKCNDIGISVGVAPQSSLLDTDLPLNEKLYGYHRLDDPIVIDIDKDHNFTPMTASEFDKKQYEENLKNITEIRTVLDTPPEAKRY